MGLFDKLKKIMGDPETEEYYDDYENDDEVAPRTARPGRNSSRREDRFDDRREDRRRSSADNMRKNVVSIHATTQLQVVLVKPEEFQDVKDIADQINEKFTVVLNLESANKEVSRRILDFLSGAVYANHGQIKNVANCTYIILPQHVAMSGNELMDELENAHLFL